MSIHSKLENESELVSLLSLGASIARCLNHFCPREPALRSALSLLSEGASVARCFVAFVRRSQRCALLCRFCLKEPALRAALSLLAEHNYDWLWILDSVLDSGWTQFEIQRLQRLETEDHQVWAGDWENSPGERQVGIIPEHSDIIVNLQSRI